MGVLTVIIVGFLIVTQGLGPAFRLVLYLFPCGFGVLFANAVLAETLNQGRAWAKEPGAPIVDVVSELVVWLPKYWLWGIDGVCLFLTSTGNTLLDPSWIRAQTIAGGHWGTVLLQDSYWAIRAATIWPLQQWHRAPVVNMGNVWTPHMVMTIAGVWLRYDVVGFAFALILSNLWRVLVGIGTTAASHCGRDQRNAAAICRQTGARGQQRHRVSPGGK